MAAMAAIVTKLLVLLLIALVGVSSSSPPPLKAALFVFGDSLYDPGNNNYINTTTRFQSNYWPYGESFFIPPTGRFSDGRLIPDFIAELAGLPLLQAYIKPGAGQDYSYGANFASAGAGALEETNLRLVISLKEQLGYFKDAKKKLRKKVGNDEAERVVSNAVYLLNFGSNDYTTIFHENYELYHSFTQEQYAGMEIYKIGGCKFGLMTMADVSSLPGMRVSISSKDGKEEMTRLTNMHNQKLSKSLMDLEKLNGFAYSIIDIATAITNLMNNPLKYGFKYGITACCGFGPLNGKYSCGGKRISLDFKRMDYVLCDNPSDYFFFDSFHPNQVAYKQFANMFWNGNLNEVSPYNLSTLFKEELPIAKEQDNVVIDEVGDSDQ